MALPTMPPISSALVSLALIFSTVTPAPTDSQSLAL